jgi:ANTAR domain/GAF domain
MVVDTPREQRLAETFVELADTLTDDFELTGFCQRLADRCADLLDATAVSLLFADDEGKLRTVGAPGGTVWPADFLALQREEGPCHDGYRAGAPVAEVDLHEAGVRWPRFAPMARAAGLRVACAVPLRLREEVLGAVAFFTAGAPFPPGELFVAQALADVGAVGIVQQRTLARARLLTGQLQTALTSRVIVEQAKGVLAERWSTTMDDAFASLRRYARSHNTRLAEVARSVVDHTLDTDEMRPSGGGPRR